MDQKTEEGRQTDGDGLDRKWALGWTSRVEATHDAIVLQVAQA